MSHILKLECTKFDFGGGSAPDRDGGVCSAPPDPLARKGQEGQEERAREGKRRGGDLL